MTTQIITFDKIRDGFYQTSDPLYTIIAAYGCWNVVCKTTVVATVNTLTEAKDIIRAIQVIRYHQIDLSKTL